MDITVQSRSFQYRRVTRQFLTSLIILSEINAAQKTRACNVTLLNDMFASTASIDDRDPSV